MVHVLKGERQRSGNAIARLGDKAPWAHDMNYPKDREDEMPTREEAGCVGGGVWTGGGELAE
jgi:hypothetical protein